MRDNVYKMQSHAFAVMHTTLRYAILCYVYTHTSSPNWCVIVSVSASIVFPCAFGHYYYFNNELRLVVKCCRMHGMRAYVVVQRCSSNSSSIHACVDVGWMWANLVCAPNPCAHHRFALFLLARLFAGCLHMHCMWRAPIQRMCVDVFARDICECMRKYYEVYILISIMNEIFFPPHSKFKSWFCVQRRARAHTRVLDREAPSLHWAWAIQIHARTHVAAVVAVIKTNRDKWNTL